MLLALLVSSLIQSAIAADAVELKIVQSRREDKVFRLEHQFASRVAPENFHVVFENDRLVITWPGTVFNEKKINSKIEDRFFRTIEVGAGDNRLARTQIGLSPGVPGKAFESAVMAYVEGTRIIVEIGEPDVEWLGKTAATVSHRYKFAASGLALPESEPVVATGPIVEPVKMGVASVASEPTTAVDLETAPVSTELPVSAPVAIKEKDIPVVLDKVETKTKAASNTKLILGLSSLLVLMVGIAFGTKKFVRNKAEKKFTARIQIVAQQGIGPKKSLMIVHVAGESMLLGVTDNNIQMLKSLSLIDDEVVEEFPKSFPRELERQLPSERTAPRLEGVQRAQDPEIDNFALTGLDEIRDVVSQKLKGMRALG